MERKMIFLKSLPIIRKYFEMKSTLEYYKERLEKTDKVIRERSQLLEVQKNTIEKMAKELKESKDEMLKRKAMIKCLESENKRLGESVFYGAGSSKDGCDRTISLTLAEIDKANMVENDIN